MTDDEVTMIVEQLAATERFDWVGIYWVEGSDLVLGPYVGLHPDGHERIRIPEGVCGAVAASGETEVVPDVRARAGHIACDLNTRSEVVVPILRGGGDHRGARRGFEHPGCFRRCAGCLDPRGGGTPWRCVGDVSEHCEPEASGERPNRGRMLPSLGRPLRAERHRA